MKDVLHLICTLVSSAIAIATQICFGVWLANIGPITVDKKPSWHTVSLLPDYPLINNISLLLLFVLQHSLLARKMFGTVVTTCLPEGFERVIYNMTTVIALLLMCLLWQPLPTIVWHVTIPWLRYSITIIRIIFLVLMVKSIGALDRLTLYGIKQPLSRLRNEKPNKKVELVTTGAYGMVRHPTMSCLMALFLITPTMSVGHLLFSVSMIIYIVLSVLYLEERDLLQELGSQYQTYRRATPAFIPSLWGSKPAKD